MNLTVLKYIVEVEKYHSITTAARELYIGQPNLSRDIKNLEQEIGFPIFTRNSKGVIPTVKGQEFIDLARKTLKQYDLLESTYTGNRTPVSSLRVSVPCTCYLSAAFADFSLSLEHARNVQIRLTEDMTMSPINEVLAGNLNMAVIRYSDLRKASLLEYLSFKNLVYEPLLQFTYMPVFSSHHPLHEKASVSLSDLKEYLELVSESPSEDRSSPDSPYYGFPEHSRSKYISIKQQSSQYTILAASHHIYMYASPVLPQTLKSYDLVQKPLTDHLPLMTDLLIYPDGTSFSRLEKAFLQSVRRTADQLKQHYFIN